MPKSLLEIILLITSFIVFHFRNESFVLVQFWNLLCKVRLISAHLVQSNILCSAVSTFLQYTQGISMGIICYPLLLAGIMLLPSACDQLFIFFDCSSSFLSFRSSTIRTIVTVPTRSCVKRLIEPLGYCYHFSVLFNSVPLRRVVPFPR